MTKVPKFELLEDRIVLDGADAEVMITGPEEPIQLGDQDVGFTLTFDNTGTETGYVPYAELIIPTSGGDGEGDGPSFDSASFLGAPVDTTVLTFDASGEVEHPFLLNPDGSPLVVTGGQEGDTLVVFELPYGSFSTGNPAVDIDVVIDFSDQADIGSLPEFQALGGFALGCDPLDNPDDDPALRGTADTLEIDPQLFSVTKANSTPEAEGATGPSYVYTYTLTVDVAPGQTLSDFTLTDSLPPEIVYLGNVNISGGTGATVATEPSVGAQVQPGEEFIVDFDTVSDTVSVTFDYFISNDPSDSTEPTNDPTSGVRTPVTNTLVGEGDWTPLDSDDPPISVSDSDVDVFDAATLAIQKTNAVLVDNNATGASPGDVYEFTLNVQVSDFFTFGDLVVEDILGDGWDYVAGSAEFFTVEEVGAIGSVGSELSLTGVETVVEDAPGTGETTITWDLSQAMIDAGSDGLLTGDFVGDSASSGSQTTVTITYQAEILRDFDDPGTGEQAISQGDALNNAVTITGDVRQNLSDGGDPTIATGNTLTDTSASDVPIATGQIESKTVFALNGDTSPPSDVVIAAGDTVTFSVIYRAPLAAFEDFRIEDNLPQLVFDPAGEFAPATTWVASPADNTLPPPAGQAYFGPSTTGFFQGQVPTISTDAPNNGLIFDFGDFTEPTPTEAVIEILFTTTVQDAIFAPDLFLTNQATAFEANTAGSEINSTAIAQFNYGEPDLNITKGVVATDANDPEAQITGPVGLTGVSVPDTGSPRFSGIVTSDGLDAENVDANIEGIDAGDTVTFAIVLENTGSAPNGAFNVTVEDDIPAGFELPPGGLNLSITDGTGTTIGFTQPDGSPASADDLFTTGLLLEDDGPLEGAISVFDETSGENVIVITYDLVVSDDTPANATLTNTAGITSYNAFEGNGLPFDPAGPVNRVVDPLEDTATAETEEIEISKTFDSASREFNADISGRAFNEVVVGEEFEFVVRVDVPEGELLNFEVSDAVTNGGLTLISATVETFGNQPGGGAANITSSIGGVGVGTTVAAVGNEWSIDFGTLTNAGDNDPDNDFIEIRVLARAGDDEVGNAGHFMRNVAEISFEDAGGQTFTDNDGSNTRLIEPNTQISKSASPLIVDAGGEVNYAVEITNPATSRDAPAFDLTLSDVIDPELTLDTGSITLIFNGIPQAFDGTNFALTTNVGGDANAFDVFIDQLDQNDVVEVQYTADVPTTVAAGETFPNTANLVYDSTPEDDSGGPDLDDREYSISDSAEVVARAPEIDKSLVPGSTSYDETTDPELGIGELVTYEFIVVIPEGSIDDVVLTDTLPDGLEYVTSEVVRIGTGPDQNISGSSLSVGDEGTNIGQVTTFTFGDLTNPPDPITPVQDANDEIVVRLTARVTDVAAASDGADLENEAALSFTDGNGGIQIIADTETVSVVEPELDITKTVTPDTADAGDTVSYQIRSENIGSGPAFDIIITDDVVGPEVAATGAVTITIFDAGGAVFTPTEAPTFSFDGAGELEVIVPELPAGHEVVIDYDAVVQDGVQFSSTLTNTAEVARYDSNPEGFATTPPVDPDAEERVYTGPSDTADLATPGVSLEKSYLSSGDANTADATGADNAQLNIGEAVTYELTITVPEGAADIVLTDDLPPGLLAQSATVVSIGDTGDSATNLANGDTDLSSGSITINGARDQVSFDFGTVTIDGADDAAATATTIVVQVTAIVEDILALDQGDSLTNTATLQVSDGGVPLQPDVQATETVDIVEPELVLDKTGPVSADPGEVVDYVIAVENTGDGPAYDVEISDPFTDTDLSYQSGSAQVFLNGALLAPQPSITEPAPLATDGFSVSGLTVLPGDELRVEFEVQIDPSADQAETLINTALVEFDSVPGDPVDADGNPLGRDDTDSDTHNIATVPFITKTPFASELPETDSVLGSDPFELAIGEEVTYRYEITLPEVDLESVVATDLLPTGMEFVSVNVVAVNGTGASGTVIATPDGGNPNLVEFDFGAMNNPSDGTIGPDDVLVFEVVARVVDLGSVNAGDTLTNTVSLDVDPVGDGPFATQTTTADVTVVEPALSIDKSGPLALSPGGPAGSFTIAVTNDGVPDAEGPAYDLDISDALPAGMSLDTGSLIFTDGAGNPLTPESVTATASGFTAEFEVLLPGETILINYAASLDAGQAPLSTFENTASADFFSVPEDLQDESGDPVARDYTPVEDTHLVATLPTIEKDAVSSGFAETPEDADTDTTRDLAIGETVTYALTLTLPEIALDSVVITDALPTGLSFVSSEILSIGSEITVGGSTDLTTINAGASFVNLGQDLTISLSEVDNAFVDGTIDPAQDAVVVQVVARVDDVAGNVSGAELTNTAGLTITPEGEDPLTEVTTTETVEIVEPNLTVDKATVIAVNPGDPVDYTVTIVNDGTAPAFDVIVADTLSDPDLTLLPGSVSIELAGVDITADVNVTETASGFSFELDNAATGDPFPLLVGGANALVVSYTADLSTTAPSAETFPNLVTVDYDGVPGDPLDENGDPVDDRDYTASDDASVATVPFLLKTPTTSNFAETASELGDDPFALNLGEEVTYTYELFLPEIDMSSVIFEDQLPAGLEFVSFDPGTVVFGSDMTDLADAPLGAPTLTEIDAQNFILDFGAIRNNEDTAPPTIGPDDVITFEIVARVTNDGVPEAGDTLTNTASLEVIPVSGPPLNTASNTADVSVVEPLLEIEKTGPVAVSPGDKASFAIELENIGDPNGAGPAYDVDVSDVLSADFALDTGTLAFSLNSVAFTPAPADLTAGATGFTLSLDVLLPDDVLAITYDATLSTTAAALDTFTNAVTAEYDSAPGDPLDDDGNPVEETYTPVSDTHTVATIPTLEKTSLSTGFAETAEDADGNSVTDLQIGETITYELVLTLPEIEMDSVTLTDLLPAGLDFVSAEITELGSAITIGGSADIATINASASFVEGGPLLTLDLSDVLNADTDGTGTRANDAVVVTVTARVADVAGNTDGAQLTNTAGLVIDPTGPDGPLDEVTDTETVEVVEPLIEFEKSGEVAGDPGTSVGYSLTAVNSGSGTAFDVAITDLLSDPNLTFDAGSAQVFLNGVLLAPQPAVTAPADGGTDGFDIVLDQIAPGDEIRVDFTATISADAPVAETFSNTATVDYDSTPGDPVDENGDPVDDRDVNTSDDHSVANAPGLVKSAFTSNFDETDSELGSDPFELNFGEEVTYRYAITLPEIALDSVVVSDLLPEGVEFVSVDVVDLAGTGASGAVTTTVDGGNPNLITFDFGAMTNAADGSIGADDVLVFEVIARVVNDGTADAGDTLTNTATLTVDPAGDDPFLPITDTADVTVVEPLLELEKSGPLALDPGDSGIYTLTITNVGDPAWAGPAYDLIVADALPPELTLNPASLSYTIDGVPVAPGSVTVATTGFSADFGVLEVGSTLIVSYSATLDAAVEPVQSFVNTADVAYDSVPGDPVDDDGNPIGETYDPVIDDHVTSTGPALVKTSIRSEFAETQEDADGDGVRDLAVGEEVTYELVLTLPEIPMDTVVLTDLLPTGLRFVGAEVVSTGAEITINGATNISSVGQLATITLNDVDNLYVDGTVDAADQVVVEITAVVENIASNVQDTQLTNMAGLVVTPDGEGPLDEVIDDATVELIEPNVSVDKSTTTVEPFVGDVILYTITIANDANATAPAFNTIVTDNLPFELTLTGVIKVSDPALVSVSPSSINGSDQLLATIPVLQPGETVTIEYEAFVGFNTQVLEGIANTVDINSDSTPDPDNPDGRDYTDDASEFIVAQPVPEDDDAFEVSAIDGIDDAQFLPVLLIDPIFTGTAEPGSNVTIKLFTQDGRLDYVRNVVADTGGHWIAIFPRVQLEPVEDVFFDELAGSVLFDNPVRLLDQVAPGGFSFQPQILAQEIQSTLQDEAYTLDVSVDRPSTLPQDRGIFNTRIFFAPGHIGEVYGRNDTLNVGEIFENIAFESVADLLGASEDPLGTSLNRFNYEFLSDQTAVPGQ